MGVHKDLLIPLGLDFLRTLEGELEDDIVYSDDDYHDHPCKAHNAAYNNLKPHPRIKQLTNEVFHKFHFFGSKSERFTFSVPGL